MRQNPASLEKAVRSGRGNLLLMMLLTLINILMICFNSSVSFPFSAFIPQLIWVISYDVYQTIGSSLVLIIGGILCFLSLAIYLPFFFLSKKISLFASGPDDSVLCRYFGSSLDYIRRF